MPEGYHGPNRRKIPDRLPLPDLIRQQIDRMKGIFAQVLADPKLVDKIAEREGRDRANIIQSAIRDELTNIWNRDSVSSELDQEVRSRARQTSGLGVLLLDLDHFKDVNDLLGHPVGDKVIIEVAKYLNSLQKNPDPRKNLGIFAGRWYQGDEFMIICAGMNDVETEAVGEKIWRELNDMLAKMKQLKGMHVTVSMGGTMYKNTDSSKRLVSRVDKALYKAKKNRDEFFFSK